MPETPVKTSRERPKPLRTVTTVRIVEKERNIPLLEEIES